MLQRLFGAACALALLSAAFAHESRIVGESAGTPYMITVGFTVNPAYAGILNGLDLIITEARPEDLEAAGEHGHGDGHAHDHAAAAHEGEHGHDHEHTHDHEHDHGHDHGHEHADAHDHADEHGHSHGGAGVENLAPGLSAQIISPDGQSTLELELIDLGGGRYTAAFVPTESGDYPIRIFGFIGELEVDETFEAYTHSEPGVLPLEAISIP
ncbi:hypothetical protein [Truepera radiovictrix]|uniref:Uncharacterized protein n=1 Tax=Truepera radiovictrix (strain DSM 17093 / CIP 108686 / LMG 22925 / RQ-24) TaxID=649638 RepID=D7CUL8_TRURR|nr:hypothetical protein [Truepera radiovictrix]ADI14009.1 hypothetical protein Trad_0875 [Truepera radiovictrix DSM 17093]WMT57431.1 hypothetical protein RCV51_00445 [Truepera radiovictrix]